MGLCRNDVGDFWLVSHSNAFVIITVSTHIIWICSMPMIAAIFFNERNKFLSHFAVSLDWTWQETGFMTRIVHQVLFSICLSSISHLQHQRCHWHSSHLTESARNQTHKSRVVFKCVHGTYYSLKKYFKIILKKKTMLQMIEVIWGFRSYKYIVLIPRCLVSN